MSPTDSVEFSRPIEAARIASTPRQETIEADPAERAALAGRFGLVSLDRLEASFTLRRLRKDLIRLKGRISASLLQACVITLDPVPAEIAEEVELDFTETAVADAAELDLDAGAADGPEPVSHGAIDLGEVAAEQLGLAIDPYPRRPGAEVPVEWQGEPGPEPETGEKVNPFAALGKLTKGGDGR